MYSRPYPLKSAKQSGIALITVLLALSLVLVAVAAMTERQQLDIRRTGNILHGGQAYVYALGAEEAYRQILRLDDNSTDGTDDAYPREAVRPFESGSLTVTIEDLSGRFNINNLINPGPDDVARFRRLLDHHGLPGELVEAVQDWLDPDQDERPNGAEDGHYLGLEIPYRAANSPMASATELRRVKGFNETPDVVAACERLLEDVIALPVSNSNTTINVNMAKAEIYVALVQNLGISEADALVEDIQKNKHVLTQVTEFAAHPQVAGGTHQLNQDGLAVTSQYYLLSTTALHGQTQTQLKSILYREGTGANANVRVIRRSFGEL